MSTSTWSVQREFLLVLLVRQMFCSLPTTTSFVNAPRTEPSPALPARGLFEQRVRQHEEVCVPGRGSPWALSCGRGRQSASVAISPGVSHQGLGVLGGGGL